MNQENIAIIMCPPLATYPKKPDDISEAKPHPCPECSQPMWYSVKKQAMKKFCEAIGKEIIFCCFDCLKKRVIKMKQNGEDIEFQRIDI